MHIRLVNILHFGEKRAHNLAVSLLTSNMKWRFLELARGLLRTGAPIQKQVYKAQIVAFNGKMQRRLSSLIFPINLCPSVQQQGRHTRMAVPSRSSEGGLAFLIGDVCFGPTAKQLLRPPQISLLRRRDEGILEMLVWPEQ
eukprot:GCRY01001192.1.p2 GENE.GCRY01001192.1~~GCRY01001192.1.p2  ORF type:complete len:141 (-),score=35.12 GCRY01001192.1:1314-1736(-)